MFNSKTFFLIPIILLIIISFSFSSVDAQLMAQLVTDNPKYFEPNGMGMAILEYNEWPTTPYDYLKEHLPVFSPFVQLTNGVLPFDVKCKSGLELLIKPAKDSAVCVTSSSVVKLVERNWIHVFEPAIQLASAEIASSEESKIPVNDSNSTNIRTQSFPSDEHRAMFYVVTFSGASLLPDEMDPIYTFSKFQHISKTTDRTLLLSDRSSERPQFILEGLPSLDKKIYYKMIMDWINDTPDAREFDVTIDIVAGNSEVIQSWEYNNCNMIDYYTFLLENLAVFTFHGEFESEIREKASYECAGFSINVPE